LVGIVAAADAGGQAFHEREVAAARQIGQPIRPGGQRNRSDDIRGIPACHRGKAVCLRLECPWAAVGAAGVIDAQDQMPARPGHVE